MTGPRRRAKAPLSTPARYRRFHTVGRGSPHRETAKCQRTGRQPVRRLVLRSFNEGGSLGGGALVAPQRSGGGGTLTHCTLSCMDADASKTFKYSCAAALFQPGIAFPSRRHGEGLGSTRNPS